MSEKKSFTGWVERPLWERTVLVLLILFCIVGALAVAGQR
jgi:hypothetical protein